MNKTKKLFTEGLWKKNLAVVQLLGLCPLLAVSSTASNAIGLGLATTLVLFLNNIVISTFRHWIPNEIRVPIYVMIISSVVSVVEMLIHSYAIAFYQSLGIFIPLIITNCIVITRAEAYASKNSIYHSAIDGLAVGIGITIMLFFLGAIREILSYGTLFSGVNLLLGEWAKILRIELINLNSPFLLAALPPGAFIVLGLILAAKHLIDEKIKINCSK